MDLTKKRVLLGVTGGIAAFKAVLLLRLLTRAGAEVRVILSENAARFVTPLTFEALSGAPVDMDLWSATHRGGENHVRLATWADVLVVSPATADFLSGCAHGACDDLLTAVYLSCSRPIVMAPAMHTHMWAKAAVQRNVLQLQQDGVVIVPPEEGELATGHGMGRMAEPETILGYVQQVLSPRDLRGERVLITAGPTVEHLDPVRFISNGSTGKMGFALAKIAAERGAEVTLVAGPVHLPTPLGVRRLDVVSAAQMSSVTLEHFGACSIAILSAAVADYQPAQVSSHKIKKTGEQVSLELVPTTDILKTLGQIRKSQVLVGFAMETRDLLENAHKKLVAKGCDLLVANSLTEPGAGFGHDTNRVHILHQTGLIEDLPLMSKDAVAGNILDRVAGLAAARRGLA